MGKRYHSLYAENCSLPTWHKAMRDPVILLSWSSPHVVTAPSSQAVHTVSVVLYKGIGHFFSLASA